MTELTSYTLPEVMRRARSIRVTDVCRAMHYPLREAGMNYVLADHPQVIVHRGNRGWEDRTLRSEGKDGPQAGGGSVEFLMRFAGLSRDGAMMALLNEFEPAMAKWVEDTREQERQQGKRGLPDSERRPFSDKIKEIRSESQAAKDARSAEER
ncbi:MAG: hypothetical protein HDQ87_06430 [Clostridia bacterium]|nr:hypothetical protein [Clostridia bacterium]